MPDESKQHTQTVRQLRPQQDKLSGYHGDRRSSQGGYEQDEQRYPTTQPGLGSPPWAMEGLGRWNYYFLFKFYLVLMGSIGFHPLENLAFAAFLLIAFESKVGKAFKQFCAVVMGAMLFYYDTWLPSPQRLLSQVEVVQGFSFSYFVELAQRYISLQVIAIAFLIYIIYQYVDKWIRTSVLVFIALSVMSWQTLFPADAIDPELLANADGNTVVDARAGGFSDSPGVSLDNALTEFFVSEKQRRVTFPSAPGSADGFDILLLNICSLSWDDLRFTGLHQHPVFNELDIVLSNYSAAASYSGPAAIRLMRASCGQLNHTDLYETSPEQCLLFENLRALGYDSQFAMNHDGTFDNFIDLVKREGKFTSDPMSLRDVKVSQHSFDGTPIYSDLDTLGRWLNERNNNPAQRVATYYNSISLHDGNRLVGANSNLNSLENFHPRMTTFLTELSLFFQQLANSNRRVMVVMVPEHGAAARGDAMQAAAFREIPSPAIVNVPVGIKFFGPGFNGQLPQTVQVNRPTSHLALSHIISKALAGDPYAQGFDVQSLLTELPETNFVAENSGTIVAKKGSHYFVKFENADWIKYPAK